MTKITMLSSGELRKSKSQQILTAQAMAKANDSPQGGIQTFQDELHGRHSTIEEVLDCVKKDGCRYYKIRWKDTWEKEECLGPFLKTLNEFWARVEQSRKIEKEREMHQHSYNEHLYPSTIRPDSPVDDRPPSPVYRNGTEYSPPASDLSAEEHSPYTSAIKSPADVSADRSPPPLDRDYYTEGYSPVDDSSLPQISSGRRKGKPKKLVRDDQDEQEESGVQKKSPPRNNTQAISNEERSVENSSPERLAKDVLTVEIPENRVRSPIPEKRSGGRVEEYPVMIIRENTEDSMARTQKTSQIHRPDALRFPAEEPSMKRPRIPTPEYQGGVPRSVAANHPDPIQRRKYISPVPSPEEDAMFPGASVSPMYLNSSRFPIPPNYHHSRYSPLKPIRNYHHGNDGIPVIYHTRTIPGGRKLSPSSHYMCTEPSRKVPSKFDRIPSSIPRAERSPTTTKLEPSQLLLKVTGSPNTSGAPPLLSSMQRQQFPVYQSAPAIVHPSSLKIARPTKETANSNKAKTPTKYLITADGEQRPQCPECFQTFKKRAALERHMMIHRGIKPFQCHFCNQRFRQKHHLQGHIMLHTGERPHSCTLCNKRFRMRHHLLEHERISHKVFR